MDILTLKSKDKLDCNLCDKCCIYRGDIRLTPINVCEISKYLNISIKDFLEKYTDRLANNQFELVLKTRGKLRQCILYDEINKKCSIHSVKPMQCVMFPLVPENLKRDYFYNSGQCTMENPKEITVSKWLNGNHRIYSKNKKICMEWIEFIEWAQSKLDMISNKSILQEDFIDKIYEVLFLNYNLKNYNLKTQMRKNMKKARDEIKKII